MQHNGSVLNCATCHRGLPMSAFGRDGSRVRGCRYSCLGCEAKKAAARYKARPEHHRRLVRLSRQRNLAAALIKGAKKRAIKRSMPFNLDRYKDEIAARLAVGECELTGITFDFNGKRGGWANPSIDRIDGKRGYVYSNVRIILHGLNTALGHWGEKVLFQMIARWQARK